MDSFNFHPMTVRGSTSSPSSLRLKFHGTATKRSAKLFEELPNELLGRILDFITPETGALLTVDQRASLTVESFASAPAHPSNEIDDLRNFRGICKRFFYLGRSREFARVYIRFSKKGLKDTREIAADARLSQDVKKVSYMVHDLYPQDRKRLEEILQDERALRLACQQRIDDLQVSQTVQNTRATPTARRLNVELDRCRRNEDVIRGAIQRAEEQRQIIETGEDEGALTAALIAFKGVEQIRLMRNVDVLDELWENFLNTRHTLRQEFRAARWTTACERATVVLARAYVASESPAYRFSSRFMDPRLEWLQGNISQATISSLSARLTCLELQVDDPSDLNEKMSNLSDVFRTVFTAARKMVGLHIGLCRPISIPLEHIFHDITWPRLRYMGFSRWNLSSDEIIHFIHRHRASLTKVRFREVRLTKGRWVEILRFLRQELRLKWASFRQVGYEPRLGGGLVPQHGFGGGLLRTPDDDFEDSESSGDSDMGKNSDDNDTDPSENDEFEASSNNSNEIDDTVLAINTAGHQIIEPDDHGADSSSSTEAQSPTRSVAGDSDAGVVNGLAIDDSMMVQHSSASDGPLSGCDCWNGYAWDDLEDDHGLDPTKPQWKRWERWVVAGCSIHDPPAT